MTVTETAARIQLLARSEEDTHLIANPRSSYFQNPLTTHTNFATQFHRLYFSEKIKWGGRASMRVTAHGDLLSKVFLEVRLPPLPTPNLAGWVKNVGYHMIHHVDFDIGGTTVCSLPGEYLYLAAQFATDKSKAQGLAFITGGNVYDSSVPHTLFIPLNFWFTRGYAQALPMCCLGFQEVYINVYLRPIEDLVYVDAGNAAFDYGDVPAPEMWLFNEYVLLSDWERYQMLKKTHEILIEQVTDVGDVHSRTRILKSPLTFHCPTKDIVFVVHNKINSNPNNNSGNVMQYSYGANQNPVKEARITLNGNDALIGASGYFFNVLQPLIRNTTIPDDAGIMSYSFALYPEMAQPSGSINFNAIMDATLHIELHDDYFDAFPSSLDNVANLRVYGRVYNVLKIIPGLGAQLLYM